MATTVRCLRIYINVGRYNYIIFVKRVITLIKSFYNDCNISICICTLQTLQNNQINKRLLVVMAVVSVVVAVDTAYIPACQMRIMSMVL